MSMQHKPGNPSTRGTFNNNMPQQSRQNTQGFNNNRMGPSGAAANRELMPVGGFQGFNNRGRGNGTINSGTQGNHSNYTNRNGVQQNFRNQTGNNFNATSQHFTTSQHGQRSTTHSTPSPLRNPTRGGGNARPYNFQQREGQYQNFGNPFSTYQPGPYGDVNEYQQFPSDNRMTAMNNPSNSRMVSPYNTSATNRNNSSGGQNFMNRPFNEYEGNQGYFQSNTIVNGNGSMNQMQAGPSFYGNAGMMPQNSWTDDNFQTDNGNSMFYDTTGNDNNKRISTPSAGNNKTNELQVKGKKPTKSAIDELKKSLHFLSADIAKMKHWNMFKDSIQMMFQLFGQLDSAVSRGVGDSKEFQIKDDKNNTVKCIFYEIDRCIPKLTRGQWYRIVGTYDSDKGHMTCLSIRQMLPGESNLKCVLTNKSTEVMKKLTMNIREL
ncbi:meiotic DNA repair synthesis [Mactra antiquata]